MYEGNEQGTKDGQTHSGRAANSPTRALPGRSSSDHTGAQAQRPSVRARLIDATIQLLAQGSVPRLVRTGNSLQSP
jgi:hypothetical protein